MVVYESILQVVNPDGLKLNQSMSDYNWIILSIFEFAF